MGGLWKLAAMSAVIGAGLVVVWQAQQSLQANADAEPPVMMAAALGEPTSDTRVVEEDAPEASPTPLAVLTPKLARPVEQTAAVANASVPPELEAANAAPTLAAPAALEEPLNAPSGAPARYSRGLDFRRFADASAPAVTDAADVEPDRWQAEPARGPTGVVKIKSPPQSQPKLLPFGSTSMPGAQNPQPTLSDAEVSKGAGDAVPLSAPPTDGERDSDLTLGLGEQADDQRPEIQLMSGERPAATGAPAALDESDPFFDAAPPDLAAPAAQPKSEPARSAAPAPADEFDPFAAEPAPPAKTSAPAAPDLAAPASMEADNADPFGGDAPAAPPRTPPSRATAPLESAPRSLPTDLDAFEVEDERPAEKATNSAPLPLELEDAPPAMRATPKLPTELNDPLENDAPAPRDPAPPVAPLEEPAAESEPPRAAPLSNPPQDPVPAKADNNVFNGDGEYDPNVPRGVQESRLTIEKIAPQKAVLGQPLVYSVVIKNVGATAARDVTIEDRIPRGTRLIGTAPQAELIEKRLVWRKLGTLQPGEEKKISIKVIPEEEGPVGSVAKVTFVSEVTAEIVVFAPRLKVTVQGPTEAKVGETIPLVFTISNPGNGDASNVIVRSVIPEGFEHPAGSDLEYTMGKLAANESRDVRLEVTALKPGRAIHQTIVTADGNVTAESKTAIEVIGEQLLLTRSGHDRVYLGRNAVFTNNVTNEGERPVEKIQVSERVPEGFDFVAASHGGTYSAADRSVRWNVGPLGPKASATVSVTLTAKSIGDFDTTVAATGPTGSAATVTPTVAVQGYPSLSVERLGEERLVGVGETVTTRIQLENRGSASAKAVALAVELPAELRFVSAKGPATYRVDGQRLLFDAIPEAAAGGAYQFELVFEAQSPGDSRLEFQVSAQHLRRPVRHEEAVQILPKTAAR